MRIKLLEIRWLKLNLKNVFGDDDASEATWVVLVKTIMCQTAAGRWHAVWLFVLRIFIQFMNSLNVRVHGNIVEHMWDKRVWLNDKLKPPKGNVVIDLVFR